MRTKGVPVLSQQIVLIPIKRTNMCRVSAGSKAVAFCVLPTTVTRLTQ